MPPANPPPSRKQFTQWVHSALGRLYDAAFLQNHPLGPVLLEGEANSLPNRGQNLRRILLDSMQTLRPEIGRSALSPHWRAYRILELRFIEGLSPNEVMEELKIGKSQFFRDQAHILEAFVDILWTRLPVLANAGTDSVSAAEPTEEEHLVRSETGRLFEYATWGTFDLADLVRDLESTVAPLLQSRQIHLNVEAEAPIHVYADRIMLRQALLKLITHAASIAGGRSISLATFRRNDEAGVRLSTQLAEPPALPASQSGLEISTQLMEAMGGRLAAEETARVWTATLVWPVSSPKILLTVDDNAALIELFRRYLMGQDWVVAWATSGAEAFQKARETRPTVILLDVMMPGEDGWETLVKLKKDPLTREIPVIICSVVQEPALAQSLGAAFYLPKPVSQTALVNALAPFASPAARH